MSGVDVAGIRRRLAQVPWVWVLITWTIFLWISRLRNVVNNDELSSSGRTIRVLVVVVFVALAVASAFAVRRAWPRVVAVFVGWTVLYWLIRGIGILIDGDYSIGFKVVHTLLMAVSLTLSALTARRLAPRR